jgi:hemolysin activation/secretion protein
VRGFRDNERTGFTGWVASAEYRLPIVMIGRGWHVHPLFLDRVSANAFVDAGNASCTTEQRALYISCPGTANSPRTDMLLSAGFEVSANAAAFTFYPAWVRLGVGWPLQGAKPEARGYVAIGQSF